MVSSLRLNLSKNVTHVFVILLVLMCLMIRKTSFSWQTWPQIDITVDSSTIIGVNNLSLGFMLDHEWKNWRDSSVLRELARNAGFKLVRFFDWKHSSCKPCNYWNESTHTGTFNWTDMDLLVNRIFEIGAEPLIALGCYADGRSHVPSGMAVNQDTGLPYPESFAAYASEFVKHFEVVELPVRFYEIWNEPFFYFYEDWVANEKKLFNFMELFNTTYTQMHQADSKILVGNDASLYRVFLDYWVQRGGKLDFLGFHKYGSYGFYESDAIGLQRAEQRSFVTSGLFYSVEDARKIWFEARGVILPAINSETNFSAKYKNGTDPRIQQMVGAVWTALQLRAGILNGLSYSIYYSYASRASWEQANKPSGGFGFGMINLDNNEPWYPYYVQMLLGNSLSVGDQIAESASSSDDIKSLAWVHFGALNILLINKVDQPRTIFLQGVSGQLNFSKIDNTISYLTPSIHTGTSNSAEPLILNGYTIIFLQVSL